MSKVPEIKFLRAEQLQPKVCVVVGTRPGIVMFSPIIRELERRGVDFFVLHTGQHYSYNMDRTFFEDLKLKEPRYRLDTVQYCKLHGEQTAEMLKGCERALLEERPRLVLVGGDANTNLAGALAARKLGISVGHIEAGERSGDWRMPEEHNRVMIDHISELLFTTNEKGRRNLVRDNVRGRIIVSGNPIVDAAYQNLEIAKEKSAVMERFALKAGGYLLMTLHREENVDSKRNLGDAIEGVSRVYRRFGTRVVFLAHPRTVKRIREFGLEEQVRSAAGLDIREPVGYLDFLRLMADARLVLTDSGGVQQESFILKRPCVTLRENTEWTETLKMKGNSLAGTDPQKIVARVGKMLKAVPDWGEPFGDGRSAERIVEAAVAELSGQE
jgi:UDP-N-acetylglucosamine 2-epimerase (non-hydrolysing)